MDGNVRSRTTFNPSWYLCTEQNLFLIHHNSYRLSFLPKHFFIPQVNFWNQENEEKKLI